MRSKAFDSALAKPLPVLFCNIGWSETYDGSGDVQGNFAGLPKIAAHAWEDKAFLKQSKGFKCGVGRGKIAHDEIHVVLVSRDPSDGHLKVVGIYASATVVGDPDYPVAQTIHLTPFNPRPRVPKGIWPGNQGVRRWTSKHPKLDKYFRLLAGGKSSGILSGPPIPFSTSELEIGSEGKQTRVFVLHRRRELRLRSEKIKQAVKIGGGKLFCEVPRCGFDFQAKYGVLGKHYAHVHHTRPLSKMSEHGQRVKLRDLAVVCANCHAMIHRHGKCRPMKSLIPLARK